MSKNPHLKIFREADGFNWRWHSTAQNGNILDMGSEGYHNKQACMEGYLDSMRTEMLSFGLAPQFVEQLIAKKKEQILHCSRESQFPEFVFVPHIYDDVETSIQSPS
jgi:uncharacterized protein YegP (UPF0339 family)